MLWILLDEGASGVLVLLCFEGMSHITPALHLDGLCTVQTRGAECLWLIYSHPLSVLCQGLIRPFPDLTPSLQPGTAVSPAPAL